MGNSVICCVDKTCSGYDWWWGNLFKTWTKDNLLPTGWRHLEKSGTFAYIVQNCFSMQMVIIFSLQLCSSSPRKLASNRLDGGHMGSWPENLSQLRSLPSPWLLFVPFRCRRKVRLTLYQSALPPLSMEKNAVTIIFGHYLRSSWKWKWKRNTQLPSMMASPATRN